MVGILAAAARPETSIATSPSAAGRQNAACRMRLTHYANEFIDATVYLTPSLAEMLAERIFSGFCERVAQHMTRLMRGFEGLAKVLTRTSTQHWVRNDTTALGEDRHNSTGSWDGETCWSPSTVHSTMLSSATGHSPFSFMDQYLSDDTISQPSPMPEEIPQQSKDLQQPMDPMQSFSWASSAPHVNSSCPLLERLTMGPLCRQVSWVITQLSLTRCYGLLHVTDGLCVHPAMSCCSSEQG